MLISISTFISTFIFSALLVLVLAFCLRCKLSYGRLGLNFLSIFSGVIIIRMFAPLEFPGFTITIYSDKIMTNIRDFLSLSLFKVSSYIITPLIILIAVWLVGMITYNILLYKNHRKVTAILKLPKATDQRLITTLEDSRRQLGITKEIGIIQSAYISTPSLAGITRPTILLLSQEFAPTELTNIFVHELSHYQNRDNLVKIIIELMNSIYRWNPPFYILKRQIYTIQEFKADNAVVSAAQVSPNEYMECLLTNYKRHQSSLSSNISTSFCAVRKNDLMKRFQYIAKGAGRKKDRLLYTLMICFSLLIGSFSFVFEADSILPNNDTNGYGIKNSKSAYVTVNSEGEYFLYIDGQYLGEIPNSKLKNSELKDLPVYFSKER